MAETLADKKKCADCGADVRPGTAFCYNCGTTVRPDEPVADEASNAWFGETLVMERPQEQVTEVLPASAIQPEIAAAEGKATEAKTEVLDIDPTHHSLPVEAGMKSAAGMRRKPKTFQRKEVEVVWEEPEKAPVLKLVLATLVFVLFTIVVFWFAMQMK